MDLAHRQSKKNVFLHSKTALLRPILFFGFLYSPLLLIHSPPRFFPPFFACLPIHLSFNIQFAVVGLVSAAAPPRCVLCPAVCSGNEVEEEETLWDERMEGGKKLDECRKRGGGEE